MGQAVECTRPDAPLRLDEANIGVAVVVERTVAAAHTTAGVAPGEPAEEGVVAWHKGHVPGVRRHSLTV